MSAIGTIQTMSLRDHALALAGRGVPVFPCGQDKAPLTARGFLDATTEENSIRSWWTSWSDALVGVPTGRASSTVVIDVDPNGIEWAREHWPRLAPQRVHITRRGWHLIYSYPAGREVRCSAGRIANGVDIRANGGYIIWWPASGLEVQGGAPGSMPQWLQDCITSQDAAGPDRVAHVVPQGEKIGEGKRNDFLSREAFRQRRQGASVEQLTEILRSINAARCDPPLDDAEVVQIASRKSRLAPEPRSSPVGFGNCALPAGASPVPLQADGNANNGTGVELVCAASIRPEAIHWLWSGWLARGKLAILAGVAGTGKSTVAFSLAATVTTGGHWPDGSRGESGGNVLIWSGEDDPADTIIPRLMAAGADLNCVQIIRGKTLPVGQPAPFDPAHDVPELSCKIERLGGAALLLVDPIVSAVSGDMHKANDVRRSLQALVDFGAKFNCAVVGITHFAKGSKGTSPQERVIGSQAFGALARLVLVCAKDEDSGQRVLARAKSNISADTGGFGYSIAPATLSNGIGTTNVQWGELIEGSARTILGEVERDAEGGGGQSDECAQALALTLRDAAGAPIEMLSKDVRAKLQAEGYSPKMIRTARERLKVEHRREGFGTESKSYWQLPNNPAVPVSHGIERAADMLIPPVVPSGSTGAQSEKAGTNRIGGHK
jgi:hypothetical protein